MIDSYLMEINRFPLLTREEEFELAVRYREHRDIEAGYQLITSNLRFVVKVAFDYKFYGVKLSDLIQEGNIGLIMALRKFDPYKGYRFISYAVWWIRAYIQNFIVKTWSLVKIGTTQSERKLFYRIRKVTRALESTEEKEEKFQRVALDLGITEKDMIEMEERVSSRDLSLNAALDESYELTGLDLLQDSSLSQEELLVQEEERKFQGERILHAMKCLNEKEVYVIKNRVMADEPSTLQEIADHLKLSRERVRQIESEALARLKRELTHPNAHPMPHRRYDPKPTVESSILS